LRLASSGGVGFGEKQALRWFRLRKRIRQYFRYRSGLDKTVVFIAGCQRSGTSMIHHLFRLDWDSITFDEVSSLSSLDPEGLRFDPLPEVRARIEAARAPLVLAKPLVESQNLINLLNEFPGSRAVWMYRHYQDVARSNVKFFGLDNGHRDLAPILAGDKADWRAEHLAEEDVQKIRGLYSPDLGSYDAAALFWYARNSLFFSRGLVDDDRVLLCRYGDLVTRPGEIMKEIYGFIGRPWPGDRILGDVFTGSKGKGKDIELAPRIREICEGMLASLDKSAARRLSGDRTSGLEDVFQ
jgi:hypothetical protein